MDPERTSHLKAFYETLSRIESATGGARRLRDCDGRMSWPTRGVYFITEPGEVRKESGAGPRVVRIGTHAVKAGSKTGLWQRLSQHRGVRRSGGGNHRGSIFRLLVGMALMARDGCEMPTWGQGNSASADVRAGEIDLERQVSQIVGDMSVLWVAIDDAPGARSLRGYIEHNVIALLSNFEKPPIDPPSPGWLGHHCDRARVRESGIWHSQHVAKPYDPAFLDVFAELAASAPDVR